MRRIKHFARTSVSQKDMINTIKTSGTDLKIRFTRYVMEKDK